MTKRQQRIIDRSQTKIDWLPGLVVLAIVAFAALLAS